MSVFVLNIATMLGLALAIDYSLFIVSRFREELARGRAVGEAVERAIATSRQGGRVQRPGRRDRLVRAPGVRGAGSAIDRPRRLDRRLLLRPLRDDVPAGRPRHARAAGQCAELPGIAPTHPPRPWRAVRPARRAGRASRAGSCAGRSSSWSRPSPSCSPPARRSSASSRASRAPRSTRPASRAATPTSRSRRSSRGARPRPIMILADVQGSPTESANVLALARYAAALDALDGIDRVEGPFRLIDPATGAAMTPDAVAELWATPREQLPPELAAALDRLVRRIHHAARPSASTRSARSTRLSLRRTR